MIITSRSWVLLPILNHCLFVVVCIMQLTWVTGNHVQDLLTVPSCKIYINSKRHNWCFLSFYNMKIFWSMSHVGWQPAFIAHYKTLNWFSPFIIKTPNGHIDRTKLFIEQLHYTIEDKKIISMNFGFNIKSSIVDCKSRIFNGIFSVKHFPLVIRVLFGSGPVLGKISDPVWISRYSMPLKPC